MKSVNRIADVLLGRLVPQVTADAGGCYLGIGHNCSGGRGVWRCCERRGTSVSGMCGNGYATYCRNVFTPPGSAMSCSAWKFSHC